jgi:cytoskeletal protein CcmA (bactofilin family)
MFKRRRTRIAERLKIVGSVLADGAVEVNGDLEGDLTCASLAVSRKAHIRGSVQADRIVVNGKVEGPIRGRVVVLKSHAHVVGDIMAKTLSIEKGAFFDGRSANAGEAKEDREHQSKSNESKKAVGKTPADLDGTNPTPAPGDKGSTRVLSNDLATPKKKGSDET